MPHDNIQKHTVLEILLSFFQREHCSKNNTTPFFETLGAFSYCCWIPVPSHVHYLPQSAFPAVLNGFPSRRVSLCRWRSVWWEAHSCKQCRSKCSTSGSGASKNIYSDPSSRSPWRDILCIRPPHYYYR